MNYVHDNEIISYQVVLANHIISLNTKYEEEVISIKFTGVMAHLFENELSGSIILDIVEYPTSLFFEQNAKILDERKNHCWPIYYKTIEELDAIINNDKYTYYIIYSAYGLNGWVLAKEIEITKG